MKGVSDAIIGWMGRSTQEIEVKLPFESAATAREALARLETTDETPRQFEDNVVLDRDDASLRDGGMVLRVRTRGDRATLTLKTPVAGEHRHKVRNEYETTLGDASATIRLFEGLGYTSRWRYQKYRTKFTLGELVLCLDETPIGCFVELEGPPDRIDAAAEQLGFSVEQYVCDTYWELHERDARRRDAPAGDLLFDGAGTTS